MKNIKTLSKRILAFLITVLIILPLFSGCEFNKVSGVVPVTVQIGSNGTYEVVLKSFGENAELSECILTLDGSRVELAGSVENGGEVTVSLDGARENSLLRLIWGESSYSVTLPYLVKGVYYKTSNGRGWSFYNTLSSTAFSSCLDALNKSNSIIINEVMPLDADGSSWVELYNPTKKDVDLSEFYLYGGFEGKGYKLGGTLKAGEYAVFDLDGNYAPSPSGTLLLYNGQITSSVFWQEVSKEISVSQSGRKTLYYMVGTKGEQNVKPLESSSFTVSRADVYINEIMLKSDFGVASHLGRRTAWAELYNGSDKDISLSGMFISNDSGDLFKWALPDVTLKAGEYTVVYFCGPDAPKGTLMAPFAITDKDNAIYLTDINSKVCNVVRLANSSQGGSIDGNGAPLEAVTPYSKNTKADNKYQLIINEICSVHEAKSGLEDWVEIYNPTSEAISLDGLYLTDSKTDIKLIALSGTIAAGGYKAIEGLTLAADGEKVYLATEDCFIDIFAAPKLLPQYSAGRKDISDDTVYLMPKTKGKANSSTTYRGYTDSPVFSAQGGYYSDGLELEITVPEGETVYYTTDGSTPTVNSKRYSEKIKIEKTTVIRAISVKDGYAPSFETVGTFRTGQDKHTLPVVCLSMTKSDLDYVCGSQSRTDVRERGGFVEYYDVASNQQVVFPAGFSIGGNSTRKYAQKTFNLHMRGAYGQSQVTYPFFENNDSIVSYQSLSLRNCGQDAYYTRIRDAFISMAAEGMHANNAKTFFVIVYLNGSYHGIYEFKENQNEDYLAAHTGCDRESVQLVRNNINVYNQKGTNTDIKNLIEFATNTNAKNEDVYKKYVEWVDEEAYTDYLVAVGFFVLADAYNQKSMRSMDGIAKWQPILYDLDNGFTADQHSRKILNRFFRDSGIFTPSGFKVETVLFNQFYENLGWRKKFAARYAELLNSTLKTENLLALYESMVNQLTPEIERHCKKWKMPSNVNKWNDEVAKLRYVIQNRRPHAIAEIVNLCNLSSEEKALLFPND